MPDFSSKVIELPAPKYVSGTSLEEAMFRRRSVRDFKDLPLTISEVSQLLWAAQGAAGARGRRTVPSAGALYPLELYIVAGNVLGLTGGIYRYVPDGHKLLTLAIGEKRKDLCDAALSQSSIRRAPAVIVMSGVYERTMSKYGERGVRYVYMEAGHAAQNVYLESVSLGLGTVVIGAFRDEEIRRIMKMTEMEGPLYIMPVGKA